MPRSARRARARTTCAGSSCRPPTWSAGDSRRPILVSTHRALGPVPLMRMLRKPKHRHEGGAVLAESALALVLEGQGQPHAVVRDLAVLDHEVGLLELRDPEVAHRARRGL